jgi:hypothetical protein
VVHNLYLHNLILWLFLQTILWVHHLAQVAQAVEGKALNLAVMGSSSISDVKIFAFIWGFHTLQV